MPIQGKFEADFAQFFSACQQAEISLRGFDSETKRVEASLNRMVDSFSGRQITTEATLMAEAVTRIGSPARLTSAELQRMGAVAAEAAAKMRRVGQDIPPKIQALADAAARARVQTESLAGSFQRFDGMLATLGINIAPEIRGLTDLAGAGGKTIAQFGALATGGAVLATALASVKVGRLAADFFDLDQKIGDATAKALGWGDAAGQRAAAAADTLARASKNAGFEIKTMATAIAFNEAAAKTAEDANQKYADSLERLKAPQKNAEDLAKWMEKIAELKSQGLLDNLTKDINSHNFSMQTLSERYKISTEALAIFAREATETARLEENNSKKMFELRKAWIESYATLEQRQKAAADAAKAAMYAEIDAASAAAVKAHELGIAFDEAQRLTKRRTEEATKALDDQRRAAEAVARATGNSIEYDLSTPAGMAQFRRLNPAAAVSAPEGYFKTHTLADAVRDGLVNFYAKYNTQPSERGGQVPAPLVTGGIGTRGATLVGPSDITIHVNVSGVMDPASVRMLTKVMSDEMLTRVKMGRQFGTA